MQLSLQSTERISSAMLSAFYPFIIGCVHTRRRLIRLDELGQTFVVRLVIRLKCKDGYKTNYPSRQTIFCCAT